MQTRFTPAQLQDIVAKSMARSAVLDMLTNGTDVRVDVV